jgi:hypothetical protein
MTYINEEIANMRMQIARPGHSHNHPGQPDPTINAQTNQMPNRRHV